MERQDLDLDKKHFDRFINMIVYVAKTEINNIPNKENEKTVQAVVEEHLKNDESLICEKCNKPMILRTKSSMNPKNRFGIIIGHHICTQCGISLPYKRMVR